MTARNRLGVSRPTLGQHFLRDLSVRDRILAELPDDGLPILEIGSGRGVLTDSLVGFGRPLVAVDLDAMLVERLRRRLHQPQVVVIHADILEVHAREALAEISAVPPYGIVGNLPYAITAPLFRKFLSAEPDPPAWFLVMVQREVAAQVVAPAGKRSLLSVSVQYYAEPELLFSVEPEAFDPPPRVRSAVLLIRRQPAPTVEVPSEARFFEVARAGFRAPRKQLHNALGQGVWLAEGEARRWLAECKIDPARRAATLTLEEWARLAWWRERHSASPPAEDAAIGVTESS